MITIVGAGPAGCLLGTAAGAPGSARRSCTSAGADPALQPTEAGRSINLALAARGIRALREAGVMDRVAPVAGAHARAPAA